jgi:patatin-like phospholipase/acyl hydrolase
MGRNKAEHLDPAKAPKRILSLDGGGIRGILTLEYLDVIETTLRKRVGDSGLLLCDYFDLIGGTSTGSIIAAALACGMSVAQLKTLYRDLGKQIFNSAWWEKIKVPGILAPKFSAEPVHAALAAQLGAETTLSSDGIRTGLMVMTKRLDTGSPWPLHNNPNARYAVQDGALRLVDIVRASTAAPTYFEPEKIAISSRDGKVTQAAFVDGGVSPYNDPALQLLMLTALQGHGFRWHTGVDRLLLISIGTGTYKETCTTVEILRKSAAEQGIKALQSLMDDCGRMNHALLQWLTKCLTPWTIDSAMGDMAADSAAGPQLATYSRFNVLLQPKWLKEELGVECDADHVQAIAAMDDPKNMEQLADLGKRGAEKQITSATLPASFDVER